MAIDSSPSKGAPHPGDKEDHSVGEGGEPSLSPLFSDVDMSIPAREESVGKNLEVVGDDDEANCLDQQSKAGRLTIWI